jgi:protein phosphatase 1 regulatory subunit 7
MKNKEGWDGKLRMEPKAVITNPEALEDSDYSDPEAPPVEEIDADEGKVFGGSARAVSCGMNTGADWW